MSKLAKNFVISRQHNLEINWISHTQHNKMRVASISRFCCKIIIQIVYACLDHCNISSSKYLILVSACMSFNRLIKIASWKLFRGPRANRSEPINRLIGELPNSSGFRRGSCTTGVKGTSCFLLTGEARGRAFISREAEHLHAAFMQNIAGS